MWPSLPNICKAVVRTVGSVLGLHTVAPAQLTGRMADTAAGQCLRYAPVLQQLLLTHDQLSLAA